MSDFGKVCELVVDFQRKLGVIMMREQQRHMMDQHLPFAVSGAIEDALMPALDAVVAELEWEPSDADLCPGEPDITASERAIASWRKHVEMHS